LDNYQKNGSNLSDIKFDPWGSCREMRERKKMDDKIVELIEKIGRLKLLVEEIPLLDPR